MDRSQLRQFVRKAYRLLRHRGHGTLLLPGGRKIRAAAVDGTCRGGRYAGAVEILGKPSVIVDFEPSPGHGHELATSETFGAGGEFGRDIERQNGVDPGRGLRYETWAACGFHHAGFEGALKVARVVTEPLKGEGERETFWIVTTDPSLAAEAMRELAHLRWSIENHEPPVISPFRSGGSRISI